MGNTLRETLEQMGASQQQLSSKVLELTENAIAIDKGLVSRTAVSSAEALDTKIMHLTLNTNALEQRLVNAQKQMAEVKEAIGGYKESTKSSVIEDSRLKDAILLYRNILYLTKDIFGEENMTEAVMIKAIEAGSYGLWRGVMGGKFEEAPERGKKMKSAYYC